MFAPVPPGKHASATVGILRRGKNLVAELPIPADCANVWEKGCNSAGGAARTMRVLMSVAMAINILENANISVFTGQAGAVECWPEDLNSPEQEVRFLNLSLIHI